jgi:cytochrome c oxidase subunit 2
MLLALIVWVFTIVIVFIFAAKYWWFPPAINEHGANYDLHFLSTLLVTGIIFFAAQIALGWVIVRYRDRGQKAVYSHGNNKLEVLWTSAAAVLFIGAVLASTQIFAEVHLAPPPENPMRVEVLAKQFAWSFRYPGPDGKFGRTELKLMNDAAGNPFGLDDTDPATRDDIVTSAVRVPVNTPVRLILISSDVIHNFFVRELRLKQDVVPGMDIPLHFQADRVGTYEVPCSELCGLGHHQMRTTLEVMSAADFEKWEQEQLEQLRQLYQ